MTIEITLPIRPLTSPERCLSEHLEMHDTGIYEPAGSVLSGQTGHRWFQSNNEPPEEYIIALDDFLAENRGGPEPR